jgi:hypothetical protein
MCSRRAPGHQRRTAAGLRRFFVLIRLLVLGDGNGDGAPGGLDRRGRIAVLLADQRKRVAIEKSQLGLIGLPCGNVRICLNICFPPL